MPTNSLCTRALCARCALPVALVLGLGFNCNAQNNAVNFTTSQPIPLMPNPGFGLPPFGAACNNLFAGKFHNSSRMDFLGTCRVNFPSEEGPFNAALLNQGNGIFTSVEDTAIDQASAAVVSVDMNGDGLTDLVVNQIFSDTIGVQLSNGDGTFKAPVYYTPSGLPSGSILNAAVAGDFEDNGRMDIAIISSVQSNTLSGGPSNLTIFLNDGTGKLTQSANYALNAIPSGDNAPLMVAGDLNGDHKVDLAVVYRHSSGTVVPFISQGNGKFAPGGTYNAGPSPISAVIGNFSDDAYGDIAVATSTGVNVLIGNSSATFTTSKSTPWPTPAGAFGTGASILGADFDKDGKLDVALTTPSHVYIFWGEGDGLFGSSSAYSVPIAPVALVASSINNNGRQDLTVAAADGSINILYNIAARVFRGTPNTHSPYSADIVAADFNGDGKKDIAVVNTPACKAPCNGTVSVFPGAGAYFNPGKTYTIGMHGSAIAIGDLNGDGVLDLVVTNATPGDSADTSILLGIKGGGFQAAHNIKLGSLSNDAFLADVNGDGKLDLVEDGGVALGNGKGDFGGLTPFPDGIAFSQPQSYQFNTHIAVADFNGDGHPDVVALFTPSGGSQQADVLMNNGRGDFTATPLNGFDAIAGDSAQAVGVSAGPINGGSINHIVVTATGTGFSGANFFSGIWIFTNDGKGSFTPGPVNTVAVPGQLNSLIGAVAIADFNHDGHNDIGFSAGNEFYVATGPSFNNISMFFAESSGATTNPDANLAVADFNNDGWPDVVFTNSYGIARLYNMPVPTVTPASLTFSSAGTQKVTIKNTIKTSQSITAGLLFLGTAPAGGTSPFKISSSNCGTLAAGASCTISVEYNGASNASATLHINANAQFIDAVGISGN